MSAAGATVAQIIEAVREGRAVLAPETAGYLVLAIADLLAKSPRLVDAHQCGVLVEGGNVVLKPTTAGATPVEAEASARKLFRTLLTASSGTAPALHAVAARPAGGDLAALVSEIESALVPVNRAAARRALSRLARETLRPAAAPRVMSDAPPPTEDEAALPMQLGRPSWQAAPIKSARPPTLREPVGAAEPSSLPFVEDDLVNAIQAAKKATAGGGGGAQRPEPTPSGLTLPDAVTQVDEVTDLEDMQARAQPTTSPPTVAVEPTPPPDDIDEARALPPPVAAQSPEPAPAAPVAAQSPEPAPAAPVSPPPEPLAAALAQSPAPAAAAAEPSPMSSRTPVPRPSPAKGAIPRPSPKAPATASGRPSGPPARGVDELLESFMSGSSRRERDVADDLKRMVGVEPTPPPKKAGRAAAAPREAKPTGREAPEKEDAATELLASTPPPGLAPTETVAVHRRSSRAPYVLLASLVAAAVCGGAFWYFQAETLLPADQPEPGPGPAVTAPQPRAQAEPCRATVIVEDLAAGTDVLVRSGVSPVEVERIASGTRVEFLATMDGFAPGRGIVPASAAWIVTGGAPRYDLTIELQKRAPDGGNDRSADAGHVGSPPPAGQTGTVRVATAPPGAEIWMLVGQGPTAKVAGVPCNTAVDLLLSGSTDAGRPQRGRLHVDSSQFTPDPSGTPTARASARLAVMQ